MTEQNMRAVDVSEKDQPTLELQLGAYLQETNAGEVRLFFQDRPYSAKEEMPLKIRPSEDVMPLTVYQYGRVQDSEARKFVAFCMSWTFGADEATWPTLAQRFLSSNETSKSKVTHKNRNPGHATQKHQRDSYKE
jgi:hypothetical protein